MSEDIQNDDGTTDELQSLLLKMTNDLNRAGAIDSERRAEYLGHIKAVGEAENGQEADQ